MEEELRLWAINVDVFRQCFAAPPELEETLREITNSLTPPAPNQRSGGLLSILGPLMRKPLDGGVIRPGIPNNQDGEAMMTSRYIASDRLSACWLLAEAWLDFLCLARTRIPLTKSTIDELEFDLVRVEIPTQLSIRHLWRHGIDISLRASDEMTIGYMEHATVLRLVDEWTRALPELEEPTREFATVLLEFAGKFAEYETPGPPPDLIAWWTAR